MRRREFLGITSAAALSTLLRPVLAADDAAARPRLQPIRVDPATKLAAAVKVHGGALLHTGQLLPTDDAGHVQHAGDVSKQLQAIVQQLAKLLAHGAATFADIARLNVYLADEADAAVVRSQVARLLPGAHPALTMVAMQLPAANGARIALDAVAAIAPQDFGVSRVEGAAGPAEMANVGILPVGPKVYVSGQAVGSELAGAARETIAQLGETLQFMGLDWRHVVQLKAFAQPIDHHAEVIDAVRKSIGRDPCPPLVVVEWREKGPVEIELVAHAPEKRDTATGPETVEFFAPPELKPSPVFSRVARTASDSLVYIGGITSRKPGDADAEARDVFEQLREIAAESGSDLRHLVKATYYTTSAETVRALGAIRPEFYDPARPPAASRAGVRSVAVAGRSLLVDMIAVPVTRR